MGSKKRLSPNAPCPCGSGKKYKRCCYAKGFHYLVDDEGNVFKATPVHPEAAEALRDAAARFEKKHGRPMGPRDRYFSEEDVPSIDRMVDILRQAGASEAYYYAVRKTDGLMLSPENRHLVSNKDIKEFEDAMAEYEQTPGNDPDLH
jgi:hypothetical protein